MGDGEGVISATRPRRLGLNEPALLHLGRSETRADDEAKQNGLKKSSTSSVLVPCRFPGFAEREQSCQRIGASERLNSCNSA